MRIHTNLIFRPSSIAILGASMSAFVWALPTQGWLRTGYIHKSDLTLSGIAVATLWYLCLWCSLRLGEVAGGKLILADAGEEQQRVSLGSTSLLICFTLLAAVGISVTYQKILGSLGLEGAILYVASGLANNLKESLYEDYSAGVVSLRYLVAFSATLSFYRWSTKKKFDALIGCNLLLLAMSALLSSRLIFVATLLMTAFVTKKWKRYLSINVPRIFAGAMGIFLILSVLNSSRNSNYYAEDGFGFFGAGFSSIVTYVGSPFQVLIRSAENPGYLVSHGDDSSRQIADIDETLNSNSAFVQIHEIRGWLGWLYINGVCFGAGVIFRVCVNSGKTVFLLPAAAILYACAELWRLDLFSQGIFIVWLTVGLVLPLIFLNLMRILSREKHRVRSKEF